MDNTKFIKGFNHGYTIAEHEPSILKSLLNLNKNHGEYFQGIEEGAKQFELEQGAIQKEKSIKDKLQFISKGQGRDGIHERNMNVLDKKQRDKEKER